MAEQLPGTPPRRRLATGLGFRARLILSSTLVAVLCLMLAALTLATIELVAFRNQALDRAQTLAEIVAANSEAALSFEDVEAAQQVLDTLAKDPTVRRALLYTLHEDTAFAAWVHESARGALPPRAAESQLATLQLEMLSVVRPVQRQGQPIGQVRLDVALTQQRALLRRLLLVVAALLLVTLGVSWVLASRLHRSITEPVADLLQVVQTVQRTGDYGLRSDLHGVDELVRLGQAFNEMLAEIARQHHDRELAQRALTELNEQLEARVSERTQALAQAQTQLVESEKMAALGGLVAGVAHEINTPLGICVTVATHLEQRASIFRNEARSGMKRSALEHFLQETEIGFPMLVSNLQRAANLVHSFKLVAVDQCSEERRAFRAAEYFDDVLRSLAHEFKSRRIEVQLRCDSALMLNSFPGVYAQILTNLCMNAMLHAYPEGGGRIEIDGQRAGEQFILKVRDYGVGMSEAVRLHVFEPFFTTRRAAGGSGLGLHIVYNQVTQYLGGSIRCRSAPGTGSEFEIRVPLQSPRPKRRDGDPPDLSVDLPETGA